MERDSSNHYTGYPILPKRGGTVNKEAYLARAMEANRATPNGGLRPGWAMGPVGQHRDSDPIARSNWRVVLKAMGEAAGVEVEDIGHMGYEGAPLDGEDVLFIGSFGHWGVGWIEEIIFNPTHEALGDTAYRWYMALDAYPVADEEDLAALEIEEGLVDEEGETAW